MSMFLLWVKRKFMRWYEEWGRALKPMAKAAYITWAFLSFIFLFIEKTSNPSFFTEGQYVDQYRFLRYTILPISTLTVFIPIIIGLVYLIYNALYNQYLEYTYFSESGGKFKNEEKHKNEQKPHDEEDSELSFDELAKDTYREAFRLGVRKAIDHGSKPVTKWETQDDEIHPITPLEESLDNYGGDVIRENFIKSSGYTSLLLDNNASAEDAYYANCLILVTNYDGSSQIRFIVAYNGSSREAYIDEPWEFPPDDDSKYTIILNQQDSVKNSIQHPVEQQTVREGQVRTARPKSVKLDTRASDTDSFYNGCLISIVSGTGVGQSRFVIGYNGNTKVATIDKVWDEIPNDSSVYSLVISQAYWRSEPAELKNIQNSTIIVDGTGTYIRDNAEIPATNDAVWSEPEIEVNPDLGEQSPINKLTSEDGEISDDDNSDDSVLTLEDLLKNQKKD